MNLLFTLRDIDGRLIIRLIGRTGDLDHLTYAAGQTSKRGLCARGRLRSRGTRSGAALGRPGQVGNYVRGSRFEIHAEGQPGRKRSAVGLRDITLHHDPEKDRLPATEGRDEASTHLAHLGVVAVGRARIKYGSGGD